MADDGIQFDIGEWWVVFVAFGIPVIYFIYVMIVCYCDVLKQKKAAILAHRKQMHGESNPVMARPHPSGAYLLDEHDASPVLPSRPPGVHRPQGKQAVRHSSSANQMPNGGNHRSQAAQQPRRSSNSTQAAPPRRNRNMNV